MPKILINEKDRTSPGTPDSYANFSVLIAGLAADTNITEEEKVKAEDDESIADLIALKESYKAEREKAKDSNGVYEFTSAEAFKKTIGLVPPKVEVKYTPNPKKTEDTEDTEDIVAIEDIADDEETATTFYHYGNQMAYELLNMGYVVLYKVIDKNDIASLGEESFWEDFKDKSSYDFRFVTHGLLESNSLKSAEKKAYDKAVERLAEVEKAIEQLEKIINKYPDPGKDATADQKTEISDKRNAAYIKIYTKYLGFLKVVGSSYHYENFDSACDGLIGPEDESGKRTGGEKTVLEAGIKDLIAGGVTTALINQANACIANLAKYTATGAKDANSEPTNDMYMKEIPSRGDCIALIEADENLYVDTKSHPEIKIIDAINEMTGIDAGNGKFCAMTVPSVHYKMAIDKDKPNEFDNNVKFPGAFHYLACFMNSLKLGFAEWYAAAGYTRGVASYMIDYTSVKLGEIAINALEPRNYDDPQKDYPKFACNVIANFRGSYYLWGNRTAHPLGKKGSLTNGDLIASSFLNIRQLCCTIKKQLYVSCRSFTFDPNSDTLWVNFCNAIRPTLEAMKADQGIRDYKILKVYTDKKATLKAKIRIIPIEAVEDFDLEVSLEDSFGETTAVVNE